MSRRRYVMEVQPELKWMEIWPVGAVLHYNECLMCSVLFICNVPALKIKLSQNFLPSDK